MQEEIFLGSRIGGVKPQHLVLRRTNRHGLIAGATGTGKTVTLQGLAEALSNEGIPVFAADAKGDLAGMAMPGSATAKAHEPFQNRAREIGFSPYAYRESPVVLWDLFGEQGHPIRTTISQMGPMLLSRLLGLNETQEGVLTIAFRVADDEGLLLLDLKDLQQMLVWCAEHAKELTAEYGNVTPQSVGAIQRRLLALESQGGDKFFGEPALEIRDMIATDDDGRGLVNILAADKLMSSPKLYATFLLWLLSELFEELPEVGDPDKPTLVFFFDEAHLLFNEAPKALVEKVEQVVRLIRSKGVGVYFVTQNPIDIPDTVAGQLGNRVQHALRAFTPRDQRAVKAAAETFRTNPEVNVTKAITELKTGEALVSLLQDDGAPTPVERTLIRPPYSRAGPLTRLERQAVILSSPYSGKYDEAIDRESAYELLTAQAEEAAAAKAEEEARIAEEKASRQEARERAAVEREAARAKAQAAREHRNSVPGMLQHEVKLMARSIGRTTVNRMVRGLLGGIFKGR